MSEKFISEALAPGTATFDTARMAAGEPGLPREFIWHGATLRIASVQREWRETGPCRHGSGEQYVRKHWYQVEDDQGRVLKIYFARSAKGRPAKACWQLFSMDVGREGSGFEGDIPGDGDIIGDPDHWL